MVPIGAVSGAGHRYIAALPTDSPWPQNPLYTGDSRILQHFTFGIGDCHRGPRLSGGAAKPCRPCAATANRERLAVKDAVGAAKRAKLLDGEARFVTRAGLSPPRSRSAHGGLDTDSLTLARLDQR
ncbi:hypothetical protein NSZ01_31570 [Nocardioides szechwanensis]|nr:hypothetical protein NSZ01_31570 [Nocardioides szechwanensis]